MPPRIDGNGSVGFGASSRVLVASVPGAQALADDLEIAKPPAFAVVPASRAARGPAEPS